MSNIVDSLRRYQKVMVLVAALGVITLYTVPLDQIFAQTTADRVSQRFEIAHEQTDDAFDRGIARVVSSGISGYSAIVDLLEGQRGDTHDLLDDHYRQVLGGLPPA